MAIYYIPIPTRSHSCCPVGDGRMAIACVVHINYWGNSIKMIDKGGGDEGGPRRVVGVRDGNTTDYYYFHLLLLLNRPPSWPRFNYQHARLFQLCVDVVVVLPGEFQRRGPHTACIVDPV